MLLTVQDKAVEVGAPGAEPGRGAGRGSLAPVLGRPGLNEENAGRPAGWNREVAGYSWGQSGEA